MALNYEDIRSTHIAESKLNLEKLLTTICYPEDVAHSYSSSEENNFKTKSFSKKLSYKGGPLDNKILIIAYPYSPKPLFGAVYEFDNGSGTYSWSANLVTEVDTTNYVAARIVGRKVIISDGGQIPSSKAMTGDVSTLEFQARITELGDIANPVTWDDFTSAIEDNFYKVTRTNLCSDQNEPAIVMLGWPTAPSKGFQRINDDAPLVVSGGTGTVTVNSSKFEPNDNSSVISFRADIAVPSLASGSTNIVVADLLHDTPSTTGLVLNGSMRVGCSVVAASSSYLQVTVTATTLNPFMQVIQQQIAGQIAWAGGTFTGSPAGRVFTLPIKADMVSTAYTDSTAQPVAFTQITVSLSYAHASAQASGAIGIVTDLDFFSPDGDLYGVNSPTAITNVYDYQEGQQINIDQYAVVDQVVSGNFLRNFTPTPAPHIPGCEEFFQALYSDRREIGLRSLFKYRDFVTFADFLSNLDIGTFIEGKASSVPRILRSVGRFARKNFHKVPRILRGVGELTDVFMPGSGQRISNAGNVLDRALSGRAMSSGHMKAASKGMPPSYDQSIQDGDSAESRIYTITPPTRHEKVVRTRVAGKIRQPYRVVHDANDGPILVVPSTSLYCPVMFPVISSENGEAYLYSVVPGVHVRPGGNQFSIPDLSRRFKVYNVKKCVIPFKITGNYSLLQVRSISETGATFFIDCPPVSEYSWLLALYATGLIPSLRGWTPVVTTGSIYRENDKLVLTDVDDIDKKRALTNKQGFKLLSPNDGGDIKIRSLPDLTRVLASAPCPGFIEHNTQERLLSGNLRASGRTAALDLFKNQMGKPKAAPKQAQKGGITVDLKAPQGTVQTPTSNSNKPTKKLSFAAALKETGKTPTPAEVPKKLTKSQLSQLIENVISSNAPKCDDEDFASFVEAFMNMEEIYDTLAAKGWNAETMVSEIAACVNGTGRTSAGGQSEILTHAQALEKILQSIGKKATPTDELLLLNGPPAYLMYFVESRELPSSYMRSSNGSSAPLAQLLRQGIIPTYQKINLPDFNVDQTEQVIKAYVSAYNSSMGTNLREKDLVKRVTSSPSIWKNIKDNVFSTGSLGVQENLNAVIESGLKKDEYLKLSESERKNVVQNFNPPKGFQTVVQFLKVNAPPGTKVLDTTKAIMDLDKTTAYVHDVSDLMKHVLYKTPLPTAKPSGQKQRSSASVLQVTIDKGQPTLTTSQFSTSPTNTSLTQNSDDQVGEDFFDSDQSDSEPPEKPLATATWLDETYLDVSDVNEQEMKFTFTSADTVNEAFNSNPYHEFAPSMIVPPGNRVVTNPQTGATLAFARAKINERRFLAFFYAPKDDDQFQAAYYINSEDI